MRDQREESEQAGLLASVDIESLDLGNELVRRLELPDFPVGRIVLKRQTLKQLGVVRDHIDSCRQVSDEVGEHEAGGVEARVAFDRVLEKDVTAVLYRARTEALNSRASMSARSSYTTAMRFLPAPFGARGSHVAMSSGTARK